MDNGVGQGTLYAVQNTVTLEDLAVITERLKAKKYHLFM